MTEAATAVQRRKRSRSPSLFPAQGRGDADPDRPLRRQAEGAGRQAPRQGGVHAGQICFPRRPRRQVGQPHSRRRSDFRRARSQSAQGQPEDRAFPRACARGRRDPRGLRGNRALPRPQGRQAREARRRLEAVHGSGPAARSVQPVPDRARDHPARPRPPLRYALLHRRCFQHRPSRRRRDPCRCRTGRTGMGRDRLRSRSPTRMP